MTTYTYMSFTTMDNDEVQVQTFRLNRSQDLLESNVYPTRLARKMWAKAREAGVPVVAVKNAVLTVADNVFAADLTGDLPAVLSQIEYFEDWFCSHADKLYVQTGKDWTVKIVLRYEVYTVYFASGGEERYFSEGEALAAAGEYNGQFGQGSARLVGVQPSPWMAPDAMEAAMEDRFLRRLENPR